MLPEQQPYKTTPGDGVNTQFDYDFRIDTEDEIKVIHTDALKANNDLVLNVDYSVSGVGNENGGSITFPIEGSTWAKAQVGENITCLLDTPFKQGSEFPDGADLVMSVLERTFDTAVKLSMILKRQVERCIKVPEGTGTDPDELVDTLLQSSSNAADSASAAATSESNAQTYASNASTYADSAAQSELNAQVAATSVYYKFNPFVVNFCEETLESISGDTLSFNVGGSNSNVVMTNGNGKTVELTSLASMTKPSVDGDYTVYSSMIGATYSLEADWEWGKTLPTAEASNVDSVFYHTGTHVIPKAYKCVESSPSVYEWQEFQDVPICKINVTGGVMTVTESFERNAILKYWGQ